jgi:transcriptional regulator with XRE-family HTH domain
VVPDAQEGVGVRLRHVRKLQGLTQAQLSSRVHFSISLIKKVEQGSVPPSAAFVAASARVLGVGLTYLYGTGDPEMLENPAADRAVSAALRVALDAYDDPRPEADPPGLVAIVARLDLAGRDIDQQRYEAAARDLPELLHQLYLLADDRDRAGEEARAALHDAYRIAASLASRYRQSDLAAVASDRHVQLAPRTGDPLRIAVSGYHRAAHHVGLGDYASGQRTLDRVRQHLDMTPAGRAMTIQLDLRAATLQARAGNSDAADDYLAEARALADRYAPPARPYFNIDASPTNIVVHWCAVPVENYNAAETVRRGARVQVADPDRPERVAHHHIDQARAWLLEGDRGRCLADLAEARRTAPRSTRHHPAVRETVLALADRDTRATGTISSFARWVGINLS